MMPPVMTAGASKAQKVAAAAICSGMCAVAMSVETLGSYDLHQSARSGKPVDVV
jgi:hypothetical protein